MAIRGMPKATTKKKPIFKWYERVIISLNTAPIFFVCFFRGNRIMKISVGEDRILPQKHQIFNSGGNKRPYRICLQFILP